MCSACAAAARRCHRASHGLGGQLPSTGSTRARALAPRQASAPRRSGPDLGAITGLRHPLWAARYAPGMSSDAGLGAAVAAVYPIAQIRGCAWIERVASRLARIETAGRVCWLKLDGYGRGIDEIEA